MYSDEQVYLVNDKKNYEEKINACVCERRFSSSVKISFRRHVVIILIEGENDDDRNLIYKMTMN
jgi:hypothetical protein